MSLRADADAFYNRGRIFEAQEKWAEAINDYSLALAKADGDVRHTLEHRTFCLQMIERATRTT